MQALSFNSIRSNAHGLQGDGFSRNEDRYIVVSFVDNDVFVVVVVVVVVVATDVDDDDAVVFVC